MSLTVWAYHLKRVIAILGVKGLLAGMMESRACLGHIIWWLIQVLWWCKRISKMVLTAAKRTKVLAAGYRLQAPCSLQLEACSFRSLCRTQ
jgi:hypothetical protein